MEPVQNEKEVVCMAYNETVLLLLFLLLRLHHEKLNT